MSPKWRASDQCVHSRSVGDRVLSRVDNLKKGTQWQPNPKNKIEYLDWENLEVDRLIGKGSFSLVYTVRLKEGQHFNDRVYALKSLRPRKDVITEKFTTGVVDLILEATILSSLHHPNIIRLHAVRKGDISNTSYAFEEGGCFLVLDLLSCTLESRLDSWRDQRCFPFHNMTSSKDMISRIEKVGLGIARGMEYLHSLNIIFRDLKPHNIGFDENGIVKIFDFGLAREYHPNFPSENRINEGTRQMTGNCGTPRYMAPEVAAMQDYGLECDVYSFSITMWEICTLNKAFEDVRGKLVFLEDVVRGNKRPSIKSISLSAIGALLEQGWDNDPSKRPSFSSVVKSLEEVIDTTRAPVAKRVQLRSSPNQSSVTTSTFRNRLRATFIRSSSKSDTQLNGASNLSRLSTTDIQCNDESEGHSCRTSDRRSFRILRSRKQDQSYTPSNESIPHEMTKGTAVTRLMRPFMRRLSTTDILYNDESERSNREGRSVRSLDSYKQRSQLLDLK